MGIAIGIATQKYKQMKSASLNFHDSASTALIMTIIKRYWILLTVKNTNSGVIEGANSSIG